MCSMFNDAQYAPSPKKHQQQPKKPQYSNPPQKKPTNWLLSVNGE